ncbi:MAG: inositol monophosphatase, partial [Betaproteobacteria bacterium]|nr:inositol monophosphatase [Betaproteobacteria bacterium]
DMAAGSLLITEAGGLVGNFTGDADYLYQRECMAANPKIFAQLVGLLQQYSKFAGVEDKAKASKLIGQLRKDLGNGE